MKKRHRWILMLLTLCSAALLTGSVAERRELAEDLGVDILAECPFTEELMHMEPEDFVKEYLAERLHARYLAVGPDFRFGYQRRGTPELLTELGRTYGFRTENTAKYRDHGPDGNRAYGKAPPLHGRSIAQTLRT